MKFKVLNESTYKSGHPKFARKTYRKIMELDENTPIEELDDWAVDYTAVKCNESSDKVRKWLTEADDDDDDITIDAHNKKVAQEVNAVAQLDEDDSKGVIESVLDELLEQNKENAELGDKEFLNVLFEGSAGTGKTSRIQAWAKENGVNLVLKKANEMDEADFAVMTPPSEGETFAKKVRTSEFDVLDKPNSVLFLDEFNRAKPSIRGTLLTFVQDHKIIDPQGEGGVKYFPNFLFTIAAVNPYNPDYDTYQLDTAEETRFRTIKVPNEPKVLLKYLNGKFDKNIAIFKEKGNEAAAKKYEGRKALANKLLKHTEFNFDNEEDEERVMSEGNRKALNARTFENLLLNSNGTKEDFLNKWNSWTNNFKKKMAETILKDYVDIDDKANQAIGKGSKSKKEYAKNISSSSSLKDEFDSILNSISG